MSTPMNKYAIQVAARSLEAAYRRSPGAVLAALALPRAHVVTAEGEDPLKVAREAISVLQRAARYLERDAQALTDEFDTSPPDAGLSGTLLAIAKALEKQCKKASSKIVNLR